jgi:hypothetical protein
MHSFIRKLTKNNYWTEKYQSYKEWDDRIREFNAKTGLLDKYA